MKIKKLIYVLVGTLVVASSCSDTEFGNGKEGTGTEPARRQYTCKRGGSAYNYLECPYSY